MDPVLGKLRWRCRRGMRELDVLLTRFVDEQYAAASTVDQEAFRGLLEAPDPLIHDYVLGRQKPPDPVLFRLIQRITASPAND